MNSLTNLIAFMLASTGLTILLVWPETGPGAWLRERVLRRLLPPSIREVLDCYVCLSFWMGLLLSPIWWHFSGEFWYGAGCLMAPVPFWLIFHSRGGGEHKEPYSTDNEAAESESLGREDR